MGRGPNAGLVPSRAVVAVGCQWAARVSAALTWPVCRFHASGSTLHTPTVYSQYFTPGLPLLALFGIGGVQGAVVYGGWDGKYRSYNSHSHSTLHNSSNSSMYTILLHGVYRSRPLHVTSP